SINIGGFISGTVGGDLRRGESDETAPSEHPTPRYRDREKNLPPKDESLKSMSPRFAGALLLGAAAIASSAFNSEQFEALQREDLVAASHGRSIQDFLTLLDLTTSRRQEGSPNEPAPPPREQIDDRRPRRRGSKTN